jgi:hypothetical protein
VWRGLVVAVAVVAAQTAFAPAARGDGQAAAESAYEKAKALADAGNFAAACPLFDASFRADPALGTLLNLADCNEHLGKTATAWAQFRELLERANKRAAIETEPGARDKNAERIRYATAHGAALEPRLMRIKIVAPGAAVANLVVKLDDTDATGLVGIDVPADPGRHALSAAAPGRAPWQTEVTLRDEGKTVAVTLFAEPPPPPTVVTEAPAARTGLSGLRKLSIALAVVGVAGLAYGTAEGVNGDNLEHESDKACPKVTPCTGAGLQENVNARNAALQANIGFAVGGALAAAAVVTWFVGAPRATDRMAIVPTVGAGGAFVALFRSF